MIIPGADTERPGPLLNDLDRSLEPVTHATEDVAGEGMVPDLPGRGADGFNDLPGPAQSRRLKTERRHAGESMRDVEGAHVQLVGLPDVHREGVAAAVEPPLKLLRGETHDGRRSG